jgi:hypothetical protein
MIGSLRPVLRDPFRAQGLRMKSARQISPLERQALAGGHAPSEPSDSAFKFQTCENIQLEVTFKFTTLVLRVESLSTINQNGDQEINKASCVAPVFTAPSLVFDWLSQQPKGRPGPSSRKLQHGKINSMLPLRLAAPWLYRGRRHPFMALTANYRQL